MKLKTVKLIWNILAVVSVLLAMAGYVLDNNILLYALCAITTVGMVVFNLKFLCCPFCGKHLGCDYGHACPYCKAEVPED